MLSGPTGLLLYCVQGVSNFLNIKFREFPTQLEPVVRRSDSTIHRIANLSTIVKVHKSYKTTDMNLTIKNRLYFINTKV